MGDEREVVTAVLLKLIGNGTPLSDMIGDLLTVDASLTKPDIEDALNSLFSAKLAQVIDGTPDVTAKGLDVLGQLRRQRTEAGQARVMEAALPKRRVAGAFKIPDDLWALALQNAAAWERSKLRTRLEIVEGLLLALDKIGEVNAVIQEAMTRRDAVIELEALMGFTEIQVNHVLDMTLGRQTAESRRVLEEEANEMRTALGLPVGVPSQPTAQRLRRYRPR